MTEFFRNEQWVVDADGFDTVDGSYFIEKKRLKENDWLQHLAQKIWVKLDLFIEAYLVACVTFGIRVKDIGDLITKARAWRAKSDAIDAVYREMFPSPHKFEIISGSDLMIRYEQAEAEYRRRQQ